MKIEGVVISGKNKGEKIGFPTVNLRLDEESVASFGDGVYAGNIFLENSEKKVAIFIDIQNNLLEAHILDFSGNLRGKTIELEIGRKLRDTIIFSNEADLIAQITRDVEKIRNME